VSAAPAGPLAGVRVLDLSRVLAGPYCTMLLADLGAEVVKVERPGEGDQSRAWGPPFAGGEATYFMSVNRGKRSVAVDLRDPRGQAVVRRLALRSDVVIENFLPGGADRLGLGRDALVAERPALVYTSIRGYPLDAPEADQPGFDFAIQGAGGIMSITGEPDGEPMKVGVAIADITTGMLAATGTLAALLEARATGHGRHVATSLLDAQLAWLGNRGSEAVIGGVEPERFGNAHPSICPYETFRARDGYVNLAVGTDGQFRRFCELAGLDDVGADPRYATNRDRVAHRAELVPRLQAAFATRDAADWLEAMAAAGIPSGPVRTIPQALAAAPYALAEHEHATAGRIRTIRSPLAVDGTYHTATSAPPLLGQHTREVLEELGYDAAEVASLLEGPCVQAALP
jgi:crotonobetainyl-CoA:carnitine CoA-transferase CaiB-like acyl-CoA transferase